MLVFGVTLLLMVALIAMLFWSVRTLEWQTTRLEYTHSQLACVEKIALFVNRQLKEVSDFIILGEGEELDEFSEYSDRVLACFDEWERLVKDEVSFVGASEKIENKDYTVIKQNYLDILETCRKTLSLKKDGNHEKAIELLEDVIEEDYDRLFSGLLESIMEDERGEVLSVERTARRFHTRLFQLSLAITGLIGVFIPLLYLFITRTISKPLRKVNEATVEIGKGDLDVEIHVNSNDEMGQLAASIIKMARALKGSIEDLQSEITQRKKAQEELEETHQKLLEASHAAGMAEVASDILHNVGNVLNSINVSAQFIQERLSNSKATNLKKVAALVSDHADDLGAFFTKDERARHIPLYLTEVAGFIAKEQNVISEKLQSLTRNIDHVKQIVKSQQGYAKACGIEMLTNIREVIEDALEINRAAFIRHDVDVQLELAEMPDIHIDKQSVMQILVNLIKNARQALSESETQEKVLTIRSRLCETERLHIEIVDNGIGILKENMVKIFRHGFTTKRYGNGFGLHSSALAAKELGGSLSAHSDGPGQGATFILELPFHPLARTVGGGLTSQANPRNTSSLP
jgi:signal transduction histidine kinase